MKLVIGSRGSKLALAQTYYVKELLERIDKNLDIEIKIIKTKGDINQRAPISQLGLGVFSRELDIKMLNHEIDIAVHSLKDVPTLWNRDLTIAATPERESYYDVMVYRRDKEIGDNSIVGTSSIRRRAFLSLKYPGIKIVPLRGNLDTRLKKLRDGKYEGIVVAEAGLRRLKIDLDTLNLDSVRLEIPPAPAQGVIGVAARKKDREIIKLLKRINDSKTYLESSAERWALRTYGGGCQAPFGALARYDIRRRELHLICSVVDLENRRILEEEGRIKCDIGDIEGAKKLARDLGSKLREKIEL
ncbi:MAG TPA: hydroxymethylbilane synthase [Methanothermococcus okinawensis]|uniref:Probable porphobilinogen deaminase n=1 Tax=Methanothermococcus okinawensis TaxID=155863 RepID=A0A833E238_9EURY|nr:hydroxymethylbilane synthase [Methanothermococcus okinawensis]